MVTIPSYFPHVFWLGGFVHQTDLATLEVSIIPTIECGARDAQFGRRHTLFEAQP